MGKDSPYYFLWRLLLPETLATHDAFDTFPSESRQRHFIRRTKEEMVHFDGSPIYPERICATLSYDLTSGPGSEQELYDETTDYIRNYYNRAQFLNRSAVRLAMTVFQRRLASSTYALMRSLERRAEKLETLMELIRDGTLSEEQLAQQQRQLDTTEDVFEARTADEQLATDGVEQEEEFEETALEATVGVSLAELKDEHLRVRALVSKAQTLFAQGEESKFEKLQEVLSDPDYAEEKFIIFTEHRDTVDFLIRRLEGLGFTGQVASIHGGMPYQERERQVELFRQSKSEYGSRFLVATDAAGEGINLQFCWLMVNYDIPWNPARLEQRMGRIHRYGQTHNPVVVTNLVAGATREGRVLRILLEKLDNIRTQLASDKVFDVVGRLLEGVSIKDYLERALEEGNTDSVVERIDKLLTTDRVRDVQDGDRRIFGPGGEVASKLERLNDDMEQEAYRRLLPGYARRFVERVAPLLDLEIKGDLEATFRLTPRRPGALDAMLPALEAYDEDSREHLTVYRPDDDGNKIWLHPGEPVFDRLSSLTIGRFSNSGLRGSVFTDPYSTSPYLFHIALITVEQLDDQAITSSEEMIRLRDSRLVGLRQTGDGVVEECPLEHLLLLKGLENFPVGSETLAATARNLVAGAEEFAKAVVASRLAEFHRQEVLNTLKDRLDFVSRGFNYRATELAKRWNHLNERIQSGDQPAAEELTLIREQQRGLSAVRDRRLDSIRAEPGNIQPGNVEFLVHALVVPSQDPEEMESYDADVESIAVEVATAYEKGLNAEVKDVSRPVLARQAGLTDWPGFDLLSRRPRTSDSPAQALAIEVKGRRGHGSIEMKDNEWAKACNLRDKYWLYVVFDCATAHPRLLRVNDPFGKMLTTTRGSTAHTISQTEILDAAE